MTVVNTSAESIARAAAALGRGHLVAFPTETVYGLGADGLDPAAVAGIFKAKGRPEDHPLILHVADLAHARALAADFPPAAEILARAFWPGPLTLILKRAAHVPDAVTGGQDTVGVRIPSHPAALALLEAFGQVGSGVVAAPSANRFGGVSPTRARDVLASLGNWLGADDMILDGGECQVGVESTIVDVSAVRDAGAGTVDSAKAGSAAADSSLEEVGAGVRILRPGGISRQDIMQALGSTRTAGAANVVSAASTASTPPTEIEKNAASVPRVSGSLASHYAPVTPLHLLSHAELLKAAHATLQTDPKVRVACIVFSSLGPCAGIKEILVANDAVAYAHDLYARLHDLDAQGFVTILIERPPDTPAWEAVMDRLSRAAKR